MDPEYGERYRQLFETHWWWRARTGLILDLLRRLQPPTGWGNILDVGCGDGLFFDHLSQFGHVEGVEACKDLVQATNPFLQHIHLCPFDQNFQPGKQYSLILMLDVLEHLENPVAALQHALELLTPGGKFIATVPAFMALWTNHDVLNHHFIRYTKSSFGTVARKAGLHIQEQRYIYHWTCAVKFGVRVIERLFRLKPTPAAVPVAPVNQALYWLSRVEQRVLSAWPLPFGSSLIVVGTKSGL